MTTNTLTTFAGRAFHTPSRSMLGMWIARARERRALSKLDSRLLRDIGVDPADAAQEAARPFWEGPSRR